MASRLELPACFVAPLPLVTDTDLPRYGNLLAVLAMVIPFGPPFIAAFALGRMVWPPNDVINDVSSSSGVMAGFTYTQQANRRWLIVVVAGVVGSVNCFLLLVALLIATGKCRQGLGCDLMRRALAQQL